MVNFWRLVSDVFGKSSVFFPMQGLQFGPTEINGGWSFCIFNGERILPSTSTVKVIAFENITKSFKQSLSGNP